MHLSMCVPQRQLYMQILSNSLFCQGVLDLEVLRGSKALIRVHLASRSPTCRTPGVGFT